jgi:hypothetical protein
MEITAPSGSDFGGIQQLIDQLKNEFFHDQQEEQQYDSFAFMSFIGAYEREILDALNGAAKAGLSQDEALQKKLDELIREKIGGNSQRNGPAGNL